MSGPEVPQADAPTRVAIVGGGLGGLVTAVHLTDPALRGRFEVTVYEARWVPGGKGASGRSAVPPHRIEEHGLHMWFGTYENAARLMRACLHELDRPLAHPLRTFDDLFAPRDDIWFMEQAGEGWEGWRVSPPTLPGAPGDHGPLPTLYEALRRLIGWMTDALHTLTQERAPHGAAWWVQLFGRTAEAATTLAAREALHAVARVLDDRHTAWSAATEQARAQVVDGLLPLVSQPLDALATALHALEQPATGWWAWLAGRVGRQPPPGLPAQARQALVLLEIAVAVVRGALKDRLLAPPYFERIDDVDLKVWLRRHGCRHAEAAPIRAFYSGLFAHPHDRPEGSLAAGVGLRAMMRVFFGYKGHLLYEMRVGMGEAVVQPLYELLERRGVRFAFFHRLAEVGSATAGGTPRIDRLAFDRLATPVQTYAPTIPVEVPGFGTFQAWPTEPLTDQLEGGDRIAAHHPRLNRPWPLEAVDRVEVGVGPEAEVQQVVLALPPAAVRQVQTPFEADGAGTWARFLHDDGTRTRDVATVGVQLWLRPDLAGLGWPHPRERPILGAFARPFDVWSDATATARSEAWPAGSAPGHVAYLVGVRAPPEAGTSQDAEEQTVLDHLRTWLGDHGPAVWPGLVPRRGQVDWSMLLAPEGTRGADRLAAQHVAASLEPSDGYVLSEPGAVAHRPRAEGSGYANLTLAGDWIRTGLDAGCVEATVLSGMQAANVLRRRAGLPEVQIAGTEG